MMCTESCPTAIQHPSSLSLYSLGSPSRMSAGRPPIRKIQFRKAAKVLAIAGPSFFWRHQVLLFQQLTKRAKVEQVAAVKSKIVLTILQLVIHIAFVRVVTEKGDLCRKYLIFGTLQREGEGVNVLAILIQRVQDRSKEIFIFAQLSVQPFFT